jgi:hypothetical protein
MGCYPLFLLVSGVIIFAAVISLFFPPPELPTPPPSKADRTPRANNEEAEAGPPYSEKMRGPAYFDELACVHINKQLEHVDIQQRGLVPRDEIGDTGISNMKSAFANVLGRNFPGLDHSLNPLHTMGSSELWYAYQDRVIFFVAKYCDRYPSDSVNSAFKQAIQNVPRPPLGIEKRWVNEKCSYLKGGEHYSEFKDWAILRLKYLEGAPLTSVIPDEADQGISEGPKLDKLLGLIQRDCVRSPEQTISDAWLRETGLVDFGIFAEDCSLIVDGANSDELKAAIAKLDDYEHVAKEYLAEVKEQERKAVEGTQRECNRHPQEQIMDAYYGVNQRLNPPVVGPRDVEFQK